MRFASVVQAKLRFLPLAILLSVVTTLLWMELVGVAYLIGDIELDPVLFWKLHPSRIAGINRQGYRGEIMEPEASRRGLRLLMLGDSSTYGVGVFFPRDTYSAQLGRMLRERGTPCQVANLGVPGYTLFQGMEVLRQRAGTLKPDVATFRFGCNDRYYSRTNLTDDNRKLVSAPFLGSPLTDIFRNARYYQFSRSQWGPIRPEEVSQEKTRRVPEPRYEKLVHQAIAFCRARGILPIFIEHVIHAPDPPAVAYNAICRRACAEEGVKYVETAGLREAGEEAFIFDEVHPNRLGHRIIAEALADAIEAAKSTSP